MFNKKVLSQVTAALGKVKLPPKKKDIIVDPRGQWDHPGEVTRIPSNDITMSGVPYPVLGVPNVGEPQMMYPDQDYNFQGADYVDEFPMARHGGNHVARVTDPYTKYLQTGGTRQPIYTTDLHDPRLRAYDDSLKLHLATVMQDRLMGPGSRRTNDNLQFTTKQLKEGRKRTYDPILKDWYSSDYQNEEHQFRDGYDAWTARPEDRKLIKYYKSLGFTDKDIMYHSSPDIVSDRIKPIYTYNDGYALSPYYKKPVQPIIYQKEDPTPRLKTIPVRPIDTGADPLERLPDNFPAFKFDKSSKIVLPESKEQWKTLPGTGTSYRIERPVDPRFSPKYNLSTGSYQEGGQASCPDGYTYDPTSNTCIPMGEYEYVEDTNDQRLIDYNMQDLLYRYSQLPFKQKQSLRPDDILSGNFDQPWQNMLKNSDAKNYLDNDLKGPMGSKAQVWDLKPNQLNAFINSPAFTWVPRGKWNDIDTLSEVLKKYPPAGYQGRESYGSYPYQELFSVDPTKSFYGTSNYYVKPNTQFIEDDIDRKKLKSIYPDLTDEDIDQHLKQAREYPDYITNYEEPIWNSSIYNSNVGQFTDYNYPLTKRITPQQISEEIAQYDGDYKYLPKSGATSYLQESEGDRVTYEGDYLPTWLAPKKKYLLRSALPTPKIELPTKPLEQPKVKDEGLKVEQQKAVPRTMRVPVQSTETYYVKGPTGQLIPKQRPITTYQEVPWTDERAGEAKEYDINTGSYQTGGPYNTAGPVNETIFDPTNYNYQPTEPEKAWMMNKIVQNAGRGNIAARRMMDPNAKSYSFTGDEQIFGQPVGAPAGEKGSHFSTSMDNYFVPFIQEGQTGNLYFNENASPADREAIQFSTPQEAEFFANHYKKANPPMMRNWKQQGGPYTTQLTPTEENKFQKFFQTLPDNLMDDDPSYDIRGYWDSEGRPAAFNYNQPKESDGFYHGYSINSNTGKYLKAPWHPTFQHAVEEDRKIGYRPIVNVKGEVIATENPALAEDYIEADLTPEEIQAYKDGGYIVEDISVPSLNYQDGGDTDEAPKTVKNLKEVTVTEKPQWKKDRDKFGKDYISWYESLFSPKQWGLNDYSDYSSFNSAFRNARESKEKEFVYKGDRYNTNLIPEKDSDLYWESKDFLKNYYKTQPYSKNIIPDSSNVDYSHANEYVKNKLGHTWAEFYHQQNEIFDKLGEDAYYDLTYNNLQKKMDEAWKLEESLKTDPAYKEWYAKTFGKSERNKRLKELNNPTYFSITSQKPSDMSEDGYWDSSKNKMFMLTNATPGTLNTTYVHELSHKGDDINDVYESVPPINLKAFNKGPFSDQFSQEGFDYVSDPTEIEARKLSTLFYLNKNKRPWEAGKITEESLNQLYDDYYADKLPYDIGQLLMLYGSQQDDLLKYLNSDYNYNYKKKQTGGPIPTRADSLQLYYNAIAKDKFYKNNPYYEFMGSYSPLMLSTDFKNKKVRDSLIKNIHPEKVNSHILDTKRYIKKPFNPNENRFKKVPGTNLYSFGDILEGGQDSLYNPDAPRILLHSNIAPQGSHIYGSDVFEDASHVPYYDTLAIKPADMLTDTELIKRVKKYGTSGIPKSRLEKLGINTSQTKPKATTSTKPKEELPKLATRPLPKPNVAPAEIIPQDFSYTPTRKSGIVVPPASKKQWVQDSRTGTWREVERAQDPRMSPTYNPATGSWEYALGGFQTDLGKHRKLLRDWLYARDLGLDQ